ncbi:hypothetical protein CKM354_000169400 [Cercospora kikuchii]|uniref:Heterokaryon incompatibility domain-containing protein n=1 Tax=Cercospora kikuchii TaxID=84275 RepID=A0A9P3C8J2_9PEZI|nr:uncharacterized protein CKM354_000169400 [Cercospora kikuchii]GIZ38273.1 hypothetical protein CKM354_000169400 [Cercospora kikuchii]
MKTLEHTPLKEPAQGLYEIRVLTLWKGHCGDQIHIELTKQTFTEGSKPEDISPGQRWEALSYTWGDESQPHHEIFVYTDNEVASLEIRANLHVALQQLRDANVDRRLWIDAICMDQSDTQQSRMEKAWQIPIMHDIYHAAASTIIWLGEAYEDSDLAIEFLKDLGRSFIFDPITYEARVHENAPKHVIQLHADWPNFAWNSPEHKAICALFARNWFGRVWTRQEAFAASDSSSVLCGSSSIQLADFRNAVQYLAVRGLDVRSRTHAADLARLTLVLAVVQQAYATIFTIVDLVRAGECFRPQDKIYGCLGMIKIACGPRFVSTVPTNYPHELELFQTFFLRYLEQFGTIRLLRDAGLCQRSDLGGPSWVPDWLKDFAKLDLSLECAASHGMRAEAEFMGSGILRVKGCFADEINEVECLRLVKDLSSDNFNEAYAELSRLMRRHLDAENVDQMHGFVRALTCPLNALRVPIERLDGKRRDIYELAKAAMHPERFQHDLSSRLREPGSLNDFQSCIRFFMQCQLPFVFTEKGKAGIGADGTQPGDLVVALLGSTNLSLLRPTERDAASHQQHHQLVGFCSMHGYNWGETLLGPLPEGVTVVPRLNQERGVYNPHYFDASTGQASFWDPRIDWEILTPRPDEPAWTINAPPGEPRRKVPNSEYFLSQHTAKLVDIYLE